MSISAVERYASDLEQVQKCKATMTYIPLLRTLLYYRSGLYWWQLVGKTNVRGFYGANADSPT